MRKSLVLAAVVEQVAALQNGAALTPPKGWLSWMRYGCTTACGNATGAECFNEGLIRRTADAMVELGYKDAGYEYVALDDCWQAPHRVGGAVVADPDRFPSGIAALADYVHAKGLKLGLYTAVGAGTCAMGGTELGLGCEGAALPGCDVSRRDLEAFVGWGIDMLKVKLTSGAALAAPLAARRTNTTRTVLMLPPPRWTAARPFTARSTPAMPSSVRNCATPRRAGSVPREARHSPWCSTLRACRSTTRGSSASSPRLATCGASHMTTWTPGRP